MAITGPDGSLIASQGDIARPFYIRSAAKPFQASVSQQSGAGLPEEGLAVAAASHPGFPAQVALVEFLLAEAGLTERDLGCPAAWPLSPAAARIAARSGAVEPRKAWHNCSGKHMGFLRASLASGWEPTTYLSPEHPVQRQVIAMVSELSAFDAEPVGVDGCGAPVLRTTTEAMARLYSSLATDSRMADVVAAMTRFPSLVSSNDDPESRISRATGAVVKGGALGCLGLGMADGIGLAVKSWDGSGMVATAAAASALARVGRLAGAPFEALAGVISPPVLGGGERVGSMEVRVEGLG